jgi:NTP pyrophosphatase (non-canonical NTP hydrolase)
MNADNFTTDVLHMIVFAKAASLEAGVDKLHPESLIIGTLLTGENAVTNALYAHKFDITDLVSRLKQKLEGKKGNGKVRYDELGISQDVVDIFKNLSDKSVIDLKSVFVATVNHSLDIERLLLDDVGDIKGCLRSLNSEKVAVEKTAMDKYIEDALKTESNVGFVTMADDRDVNSRLIHGVMGCVTESGELADALKRHIFYKKELDLVNLKEEIGDIMWYLAILCDELGTTFEELADINIKKLSARYPDKFTSDKALNRDLEKEREVLETNANNTTNELPIKDTNNEVRDSAD